MIIETICCGIELGVRFMRTVWWENGKVFLINQRKLPEKIEYVKCSNLKRVGQAIKTMEVRGAPAIGVTVAMGLALAAFNSNAKSRAEFYTELERAADFLRATRPTARNLFWAVEIILRKAYSIKGEVEAIVESIIDEARAIAKNDIEINKAMGMHGASLLDDGDVVGTICNAGWLATAGEYGTALGVIKVAHEQAKRISVIALETRPLLQGARLTAFELTEDGIPVNVITDSAIGYCFNKGMIDKFLCGADRILVNEGCTIINKIGTHMVSIAAMHYQIPFYTVAPLSTFDFNGSLKELTIEERDPNEIAEINGKKILPQGVLAFNPAFDITLPQYVTAIITERGILYPPFQENLSKIM